MHGTLIKCVQSLSAWDEVDVITPLDKVWVIEKKNVFVILYLIIVIVKMMNFENSVIQKLARDIRSFD